MVKASADAASTAPNPRTEHVIAVMSPRVTPIRLAKATRGPELIACPVTIRVVGPGIRITTVAAAAKASQSWNEIMGVFPLKAMRAQQKQVCRISTIPFLNGAHGFVNAVSGALVRDTPGQR